MSGRIKDPRRMRLKRLRDYFNVVVLGIPSKKQKKLTVEQIQQIVALRARGVPIKRLARMYGVQVSMIKYWTDPLYNLHWKTKLNALTLKSWRKKRQKEVRE